METTYNRSIHTFEVYFVFYFIFSYLSTLEKLSAGSAANKTPWKKLCWTTQLRMGKKQDQHSTAAYN